MSSNSYTFDERTLLLNTAAASIDYGLERGAPLSVDPDDFPATLRDKRATFVTLTRNEQLRGCIGTLEAYEALISNVARNAYSAAFSDPRFAPLSRAERGDLAIKISILTPPEPLAVVSEDDLIAKLRPHVDGVILDDGHHRATFLPSVWESLPERREFLRHLKHKAGMNPDAWSPTIKVRTYRAIEID